MALKSNLNKLAAALARAADNAAERTARTVESKAQALVAVDTGALRTSIQVDGASDSGERVVHAGQGLNYAPFVEYGTTRQSAQPFMTPASENTRPEMKRIVADEARKAAKDSSL